MTQKHLKHEKPSCSRALKALHTNFYSQFAFVSLLATWNFVHAKNVKMFTQLTLCWCTWCFHLFPCTSGLKSNDSPLKNFWCIYGRTIFHYLCLLNGRNNPSYLHDGNKKKIKFLLFCHFNKFFYLPATRPTYNESNLNQN